MHFTLKTLKFSLFYALCVEKSGHSCYAISIFESSCKQCLHVKKQATYSNHSDQNPHDYDIVSINHIKDSVAFIDEFTFKTIGFFNVH